MTRAGGKGADRNLVDRFLSAPFPDFEISVCTFSRFLPALSPDFCMHLSVPFPDFCLRLFLEQICYKPQSHEQICHFQEKAQTEILQKDFADL